MRHFIFCLAVMAGLTSACAEHTPLLPRPQQVHYSEGNLPLSGLSICFASKPSAEDQFAAEQLSMRLSALAGKSIPIGKGRARGRTIRLERTGEVDALPAVNETPGPESRESYTLEVTPGGARIQARSSAGLFYGTQTLVQMVEEAGPQAVLPAAEVRDWPALAYRGFMMDFSHGELLRVSEIERQLDLLARFKANQVLLLFGSQHRVPRLRTGHARWTLYPRGGPAHYRLCAPASYRCGPMHGALRPYARSVPRREIRRPWNTSLRG